MAGPNARNVENRRICGETVIHGDTEWVCIRSPHNYPSLQATFDPDTQTFALEPPQGVPEWDKHYMVRRSDYVA